MLQIFAIFDFGVAVDNRFGDICICMYEFHIIIKIMVWVSSIHQ